MTVFASEFAYGPDGRLFALRVVNEGDAYGRNGCLTYDDPRPMVEFYDTTHAGEWPDTFTGDLGQFVSRYYLETLLSGDPTRGICLDGGVPEWTVTGESLAQALASPALLGAVKHG